MRPRSARTVALALIAGGCAAISGADALTFADGEGPLNPDERQLEEETPLANGTIPQRTVVFGRMLPINMRRRLDFTITFSSDTTTLRVDVERTPLPYTLGLDADQYVAAPRIIIGDNGPSPSRTIRYDDIVVDVK